MRIDALKEYQKVGTPVQPLTPATKSGRSIWGKRLLIAGAIIMFVCGIGFYSQMGSFTEHTDPRLAGAAEVPVDEATSISLDGGCHQAWVLSKMKDVDIELETDNGSKVEESDCDAAVEGELEPIGADGESFIQVGEWDLPKGEFHAFAFCADDATKCDSDGIVWVMERDSMMEGLMGETLMWGFFLGCVLSLCMIPLGLTLNVLGSNRKEAGGVMVIQGESGELITAQPEQSNQNSSTGSIEVQRLSEQSGMLLSTDQVYSLMNSDEEGRRELINKIEEENKQKAVPNPFISEGKPTVDKKLEQSLPSLMPEPIEDESQSFNAAIEDIMNNDVKEVKEVVEKGKEDTWKSWDEG